MPDEHSVKNSNRSLMCRVASDQPPPKPKRKRIGGLVREPDEGSIAHLWQLLMAGQLPILAYFAIKSDYHGRQSRRSAYLRYRLELCWWHLFIAYTCK